MLYNKDGMGDYAVLSSGMAYGQEFEVWRYTKSFIAALIVSLFTREEDNALKVTIGTKRDGNVKIAHTWMRKHW